MLLYKNNHKIVKTVHGVTFQPGEIKESPEYINDLKFQRVFSMPQEPPKSVEVKKDSKKEVKQESTKDVKKPNTIKEEKQEEKLDGSDSDQ